MWEPGGQGASNHCTAGASTQELQGEEMAGDDGKGKGAWGRGSVLVKVGKAVCGKCSGY